MKFISQRTLLLGLCGLSLLLIPLLHRLLAPIFRAPPIQPLTASQPASPTSGFIMDTLSFIQFQNERQEVFLSARRATSEDTDNRILLTGIAAKLYDSKGKTVRIQSGEAVYDNSREEITLRKSVRITTDDFTGTTDELHYYPEVKLAETSDKIELSRSGLRITGTGFNYDMKTSELLIGGHGRVHCVLD